MQGIKNNDGFKQLTTSSRYRQSSGGALLRAEIFLWRGARNEDIGQQQPQRSWIVVIWQRSGATGCDIDRSRRLSGAFKVVTSTNNSGDSLERSNKERHASTDHGDCLERLNNRATSTNSGDRLERSKERGHRPRSNNNHGDRLERRSNEEQQHRPISAIDCLEFFL